MQTADEEQHHSQDTRQYRSERGRGRGGGGGGRGRGGGRGGLVFRGGGRGGVPVYNNHRSGGYDDQDRGPPPSAPPYNSTRPLSSPPSRPLTRVMARARGRSSSKDVKDGNNQDAYRMEVNEYFSKGDKNTAESTIPCVTVRDLHTFIPDNKQKRIWIPVAVCEQLTLTLKESTVDKNGNAYDITKLPLKIFQCPVTRKKAEILKDGDSIRLRTYMNCPTKEDYKAGDIMEVIELRNELMGRLIKFIEDVAIRYRPVNAQMAISSLYSYSGERRFYYNLRETRWGLRLHISQVTDMSRNVIAIPLEVLGPFRDRLNQAIDFLGIDKLAITSADEKGEGNSRKGSGRSGRGLGRGRSRRNNNSKRSQQENGDNPTAEVNNESPTNVTLVIENEKSNEPAVTATA